MGFRSNNNATTTTSSSSSGSSVSGGRGRGDRRGGGTALTPKSLLRKYSLPLAAYLHTPEAPPGLDTSRPLLLYSNYASTKVRAISLKVTREGGLYPTGPSLVIPDSYTGWFSIVSSEGRSAPYHSTVEQVAESQLPFFLTRFDIPAYTKVTDPQDGGRTTYRRTVIQSGHVLKLLGVFEDLNAGRNLEGRRKDSFASCNKYAQCTNYCNEVIFVPYSVTGRFYATAHRGTKNVSHLFLMSQLLTTFQLPLTVRLICGYMPRVPHAFTGILRLEQSQKEDVVLACTMTPEAKATLLEMDVSSNFILSPVTDPIFSKSPIFLKTNSYCADEADSWRRQIKVTHHVTEDSSGSSLGRSSSGDKTMESTGSSSSKGFSSFFEKRRSRGRDKSRTRDYHLNSRMSRDKSKDLRPLENDNNRIKKDSSSKEIPMFFRRGREKSRERGFRDRMMDKLHDVSSPFGNSGGSNQCVVTSGEFISIRVDEKTPSNKKDQNNRKLSKQNTYIFQNERILKDKKESTTRQTSEEYHHSLQSITQESVENQDYSTVLDDISNTVLKEEQLRFSSRPSPTKKIASRPRSKEIMEDEDEAYAEIFENKIVSDKSGIVRADNRRNNQYWTNYSGGSSSDQKDFSSLSSTEGDRDNSIYTFTLLKKDMSKCYAKLPGLGYNDVIRHRQRRPEESVR